MTQEQVEGALDTERLPLFRRPPVVEVALSVSFRPLIKVRTIELVRAWDSLFRDEFPIGQEQLPYQMPVERFGGPVPSPGLALQLTPGLAQRLVLLDAPADENTKAVHLQNSWFARNWRKAGQEYPRYLRLRDPFADGLSRFHDHLVSNRLGDIQPLQCELTYVNHIETRSGEDLGELLVVFERHSAMPTSLAGPENTRFSTQFTIVAGAEQVGRVHVQADPVVRRKDMQAITQLRVTARGRPLGEGIRGALDFLDLAHVRAVEAFTFVTRPEMHVVWGRTDQ